MARTTGTARNKARSSSSASTKAERPDVVDDGKVRTVEPYEPAKGTTETDALEGYIETLAPAEAKRYAKGLLGRVDASTDGETVAMLKRRAK